MSRHPSSLLSLIISHENICAGNGFTHYNKPIGCSQSQILVSVLIVESSAPTDHEDHSCLWTMSKRIDKLPENLVSASSPVVLSSRPSWHYCFCQNGQHDDEVIHLLVINLRFVVAHPLVGTGQDSVHQVNANSLMVSVPTYSATLLMASRVWIPAPGPLLLPSLFTQCFPI